MVPGQPVVAALGNMNSVVYDVDKQSMWMYVEYKSTLQRESYENEVKQW